MCRAEGGSLVATPDAGVHYGPCFVATLMGAAGVTWALWKQRKSRDAATPTASVPQISLEDLRCPKRREHHLAWNTELHSLGTAVLYAAGNGGVGAYVVIGHRAVLRLSQDERLSSNPFADNRLIALNTMARDRHAVVSKLLQKFYQHREMRRLEQAFLITAEEYAAGAECLNDGFDVVTWAKKVHMANTLKVLLGPVVAPAASHYVDALVQFNDDMVRLVAPLGGVGLPCPPLWSFSTLRFLRGAFSAAPALLTFLWRAGAAGFAIARPDKTLSRSDLGSGVWHYPELLPQVPRYFLVLMDLWDSVEVSEAPNSPIEVLKAAVASRDISLAEALVTIVQLMVNMTSANALANMVFRLAGEPTSLAENDSIALDAFVAEVLRLDAPLQRNPRRALEPVEVEGVVIPRGANVLLFVGAANMDPAVFTAPEAFRPGREEQSMTFGAGPHYCLGSYLVKTEMREALRFLVSRFKDFRVKDFERVCSVDVGNYGFESLNMSMTPKPR